MRIGKRVGNGSETFPTRLPGPTLLPGRPIYPTIEDAASDLYLPALVVANLIPTSWD